MPKPFRPLKTISTTLTIFIILLAFPATAIMASWKSIPGSTLYPIKRGLEKVALALLPDSFYETQFRLKLIDRRTAEATISIIKSPNEMQALNELLAEAKAAQFATTSLEETQERSQAIQQLITKLTSTNQTLEAFKTTPSTTSPNDQSQPTDNNQPILPPYIQSSTQTTQEPNPPPPQPDPQPDDNSDQITDTQDQIDDIIDNLQQQTNDDVFQNLQQPTNDGITDDPQQPTNDGITDDPQQPTNDGITENLQQQTELVDKCDFCGGSSGNCKNHFECFQHQGEARCIPKTQADQDKKIKQFEKCL